MMRVGSVSGKLRLLMLMLTLVLGGTAAEAGDCERSMKLGSMKAFAEMVSVGVKELALSSTLSAAELENLRDDARAIAEQYDVRLYEEDDLLVTDLFPHDIAVGKKVLLIYKGDTLEKYLALKSTKAAWVEAGEYDEQARASLARDFGRLLSYPDESIDRMLSPEQP
ncbi:MAG: hypothetical protein RQ826_02495 [Xanthomonadales bacterium]|nr:hypothetical protein [Xanthomonadales bacterium]